MVQKVGASLTAGCLGSFVATPCDLVLVRMQSDKRPGIPEEARRNYTGVFNAFSRIVSEEGPRAMYTGAVATCVRAMALNMFMLVSFDEAKERITKAMPEGTSALRITIQASMVSSIFTAGGSLPFDNIKTKLQIQ